MLPVQTAINRRLAIIRLDGDMFFSSLVSFATGSVFLGIASGILSLVYVYAFDNTAIWRVSEASPWMYTGGFVGAAFILSTMLFAPRIGMTKMYMAIVLGQLASSLLYDHFGVLNIRQEDATVMRIVGERLVQCVQLGLITVAIIYIYI